ncbi:tRNA (adenosine(37)-N6)-threonylcarbamoyltransferase complex ATPase subunit type 1 TsaE [Candidatus Amarolinea dominans]|uniref:tRNA (adenosine(37)-N6)-threonylcarbamoyltransferase complex ATPase subunit type 1 TsaE n=1 Tax=Candidatus Amarolinea dominans TaxID=3140696 RepID=UPI0031CC6264
MSDESLTVATHTWISHSPAATFALGQQIGRLAQPGDVLALSGDLGAGKTALVQGIGAGLGIADQITSPTFTLVGEYDGRLHLFHVDVYRLVAAPAEALAFGLDDLLGADGLTVIEWANLVATLLPADRLEVQLTWLDDLTRRLVFTAHGARHAALLHDLAAEMTP